MNIDRSVNIESVNPANIWQYLAAVVAPDPAGSCQISCHSGRMWKLSGSFWKLSGSLLPYASVAQLDRACVFGTQCCRFNSGRGRQISLTRAWRNGRRPAPKKRRRNPSRFESECAHHNGPWRNAYALRLGRSDRKVVQVQILSGLPLSGAARVIAR